MATTSWVMWDEGVSNPSVAKILIFTKIERVRRSQKRANSIYAEMDVSLLT